jgi:hypothetical protein
MKLTRQEFEQLRRRVSALEAVLTPELRREADLIRKAEFVVDVAKAEGMLLPPANVAERDRLNYRED